MKFTFRQLAYFIAAAETGSITAASKFLMHRAQCLMALKSRDTTLRIDD